MYSPWGMHDWPVLPPEASAVCRAPRLRARRRLGPWCRPEVAHKPSSSAAARADPLTPLEGAAIRLANRCAREIGSHGVSKRTTVRCAVATTRTLVQLLYKEEGCIGHIPGMVLDRPFW